MSDMSLQLQWYDPASAGQSLRGQLIPWCKERLERGDQLAVTVMPLEDARSLRQNAFYWGFVLKHVSEQARTGGLAATAQGWHLYFKREILGYKHSVIYIPGNKRATPQRELRSTRGLSVSAMSKYLDTVMAKAATEFCVAFPAMTWEEWRA